MIGIMENISIRKATPQDVDQLQKIGRQTFFESFSALNTEANMNKYLEEGFSMAKLTAELNDPNAEIYFATLDGTVVGYLKLNFGPAQTELKDERAVEIERIYVSKAFHGKKIGQALYEKAVGIARQRNAEYIWLGVWEKNTSAIGFYRKNGFVEFDRHIFRLGDEEQIDLMMKFPLT